MNWSFLTFPNLIIPDFEITYVFLNFLNVETSNFWSCQTMNSKFWILWSSKMKAFNLRLLKIWKMSMNDCSALWIFERFQSLNYEFVFFQRLKFQNCVVLKDKIFKFIFFWVLKYFSFKGFQFVVLFKF